MTKWKPCRYDQSLLSFKKELVPYRIKNTIIGFACLRGEYNLYTGWEEGWDEGGVMLIRGQFCWVSQWVEDETKGVGLLKAIDCGCWMRVAVNIW